MFIYPNPVRDKVHFKLENIESDSFTLSIEDNQGKDILKLESNKIQDLEKLMNHKIKNMPNGVYIVSISFSDRVLRKRLLLFR